MTAEGKTLDEVHARLGYHPIGGFWSKLEILFGLGAASVGMLLGGWTVSRPAVDLSWAGAAFVLFVLGWYLALAGHRSHLYRSLHGQTTILLEELRRAREETRQALPDHHLAGIKRDEHSR